MITQTEVELYVRIKPYYEFVGFVSSMPGMTGLSSTIILAETGDYLKPMMVQCALATIKSKKQPFTPTDYEEWTDPQNHMERVVLNENNVFAYLESLSCDSSKLVKRNNN